MKQKLSIVSKESKARTLNSLVEVELNRGNADVAKNYYESCIALGVDNCPTDATRESIADALVEEAKDEKDYNVAKEKYEAAINMYRQLSPIDHLEIARIYRMLGDVAYDTDHNDDAIQFYCMSVNELPNHENVDPNSMSLPDAFREVGLVTLDLKVYDESRAYFEVEKDERDENDPKIAEAWYNLARVEKAAGNDNKVGENTHEGVKHLSLVAFNTKDTKQRKLLYNKLVKLYSHLLMELQLRSLV